MKALVAKFRTGFRTGERKFSPTGNGYETTYKPVIDDDGNCDVVVDTKVNFYQMIQEHRAGTDLKTMIARYEHGDINALNRTQGMFADLTTAPTSLIDFYNRINDADTVFHRLPIEVQNEFDNNSMKFWQQIDSGRVLEVLTKYNHGKSEKRKISTDVINSLAGSGTPTPTPDTKDGELNV